MCGSFDSLITLSGVETHSLTPSKYLNPSLIDFIDHLQSFEYIPEISDIADLMDLHTSTVWKLMKALKQRGLVLQGLVDVTRMGMVEVILIFDRLLGLQEVPKCMLREYSPILPWGSYLRYLVPRGLVESFLNSLYAKLGVEAREVYILPITIHSKPSLREYYDVNSRRFLPEWERLVTRIKSYSRESLPRETLPERVKYDEIDLYLVRELEINPFNSVKYIARKLKEELYPDKTVNYILVLRHYNNHVKDRGVIKGVRLKLEEVTLDTPIKTLSVVVGNPIDLLRISRVLSAHPYFLDAYINIPDSVLVTQALIPPGSIFSLSLFLEELKSGGLIKTWRNIYLDRTRLVKYAFPVKIHSLTIDEMLNASDEKLLIRKIT
ncbi:MAG: hypothetical protein QXP80_06110 [Zestosphaera sp.]